MIDDERLCAGCCRAEECHKGLRPDEEAMVDMTDYMNKIDLLLAMAELPNDATKKDILKMVYDFPAKNLVSYGIGSYVEEVSEPIARHLNQPFINKCGNES